MEGIEGGYKKDSWMREYGDSEGRRREREGKEEGKGT